MAAFSAFRQERTDDSAVLEGAASEQLVEFRSIRGLARALAETIMSEIAEPSLQLRIIATVCQAEHEIETDGMPDQSTINMLKQLGR